jgi:hypothetical protein
MKKYILVVSAILVAAFVFAACGGGESAATPRPTQTDDGDRTNDGDQNRPPSTTYADALLFEETLMDLDEREIVLLVNTSRNLWSLDLMDPDRTANDTIRVTEILRQIEADYNCTIVIERHESQGFLTMLRNNRAVGDTPYDIIEVGITDFGTDGLWLFNLAMPMTDPLISDVIKPFENPWPGAGFATIGNTKWAVHFRPFNSPTVLGPTLIFNETLRERFSMPNLYDMVRNKTWNWDAFDTMMGMVSTASNGQVFPVIYSSANAIMPSLIASNNGAIAVNTIEGIYFVGDINENALEAMNFAVSNIAHRGYFHRTSPVSGHGNNILPAVVNGEAFFIFDYYQMLRNLTAQNPGYENDFTFGLLPPPLGPKATEYTSVLYSEVIYHIANDIRWPEEAAAILVAMANRTIQRPETVIDHELRYTLQNQNSADMLEILMNNVTIDISRVVAQARTQGDMGTTGAVNRILGMRATPIQAMIEMATQQQEWYNVVNDLIRGIHLANE